MTLEYKFENRGVTQVRPTGSDKRSPCWYMLAAVLTLSVVGGAWLFLSGYLTPVDSNGAHAVTLRGKMAEQESLIEKQTADIKALEDQLTTAKREQQVQVAANDELSKKYATASADLAAEREKMVLYEGIMTPSALEQGLHIQSFGIKPSMIDKDGKKTDKLHHYHLVLSNITKGGDSTVDGKYSITITGKQGGKSATVTQNDVTPEGEKATSAFSVKHYQSLEGDILFPKDFTPESVKLKVSPSAGEAPDRLTKTYDWATVSKPISDAEASTNKE
jgi:hypothetical protein